MTFQVNTPKLTAKTKGQKITFELMVKVGQLRHSCLRFQVIIKKRKKKPQPIMQREVRCGCVVKRQSADWKWCQWSKIKLNQWMFGLKTLLRLNLYKMRQCVNLFLVSPCEHCDFRVDFSHCRFSTLTSPSPCLSHLSSSSFSSFYRGGGGGHLGNGNPCEDPKSPS